MDFYGICFEPYVGPWDNNQPVLYNSYSLAQVTKLLETVATRFSRIRTYGQGTFVWKGAPFIQDSNRYNIQAASSAGMKVTAGCYQQGADPKRDSINVDWTKTEIDYAICEAQNYGNVDELVVGNECLWGPNSTADITTLIAYAKTRRKAHGFTADTLPVTTCQSYGVLAGVNNLKHDYAPMRKALLKLVNSCESFIYANLYAYFDPTIAGRIGTDQKTFTKAVVASSASMLSGLTTAFSSQKVTLEVRIGETGWPTHGTQSAQPDAIASDKHAKWFYAAMTGWLKKKAFLFEAYDEPWKGSKSGTNSEAHFGMWKAIGTSTMPSQYTLDSETLKYL